MELPMLQIPSHWSRDKVKLKNLKIIKHQALQPWNNVLVTAPTLGQNVVPIENSSLVVEDDQLLKSMFQVSVTGRLGTGVSTVFLVLISRKQMISWNQHKFLKWPPFLEMSTFSWNSNTPGTFSTRICVELLKSTPFLEIDTHSWNWHKWLKWTPLVQISRKSLLNQLVPKTSMAGHHNSPSSTVCSWQSLFSKVYFLDKVYWNPAGPPILLGLGLNFKVL